MASAADETAKWGKIEAEYHAGASLASICKKHKIGMRALFAKIREGGWKRAGDKAEEPKRLTGPPESVATPDDTHSDETSKDALRRHKHNVHELEALGDLIQAELRDQLLISRRWFDREEQLAFAERRDKEGWKIFTAWVSLGKQMTENFHRLANTRVHITTLDRKNHNLDDAKADNPEAESYDDLLEQLKTPVADRVLPDHVIDFEKKIAHRRAG